MADPQLDALATYNELIEKSRQAGKEEVAAELISRRDALSAQIWGGAPQAPPQEDYRSAPMRPPPAPAPAPVSAPPPAAPGEALAAIPPQQAPAPPPQAPPPQQAPVTPQRGFAPSDRLKPVESWSDWAARQVELIKNYDPMLQALKPRPGVSPERMAGDIAQTVATNIPLVGPFANDAAAFVGSQAGIGEDYQRNLEALRAREAEFKKNEPVVAGTLGLLTNATAAGAAAAAPIVQASPILSTALGVGAKTPIGAIARGGFSGGLQAAAQSLGSGIHTRDIYEQLAEAKDAAYRGIAFGAGLPAALGAGKWGLDKYLAAVTGKAPVTAATLPSRDAQRAEAKSGYENPEFTNAEMTPQRAQQLANSLKGELGPNPDLAFPHSLAKIERFEHPFSAMTSPMTMPGVPPVASPAMAGWGQYLKAGTVPPPTQGVPLSRVEDLRKTLPNIPIGAEKPAGQTAVRQAINKFYENIQQGDLLSGTATNINKIITDARRAASGYLGSDWTMKKILEKAEIKAPSAHSGENFDNKIRQYAAQASGDEKVTRYMTQAEKDQLKLIAQGSPERNLGRRIGKMMPSSGFTPALTGSALVTAAQSLGIPKIISLPLLAAAYPVAAGFRKAATAGTVDAVKRLEEMFRAKGAGVQKEFIENIRKNEMLNNLFGAAGGVTGRQQGGR